jgi:hypothetical protein
MVRYATDPYRRPLMSHEADSIPIVLQQVSSEELPSGEHQLGFECATVGDYFCMPSTLIIGPDVYLKTKHVKKRSIALYVSKPAVKNLAQ